MRVRLFIAERARLRSLLVASVTPENRCEMQHRRTRFHVLRTSVKADRTLKSFRFGSAFNLLNREICMISGLHCS
jgi:hypothetical protein